jgi:hypothetical protein
VRGYKKFRDRGNSADVSGDENSGNSESSRLSTQKVYNLLGIDDVLEGSVTLASHRKSVATLIDRDDQKKKSSKATPCYSAIPAIQESENSKNSRSSRPILASSHQGPEMPVPSSYIKCCDICGGTNWGMVRTEPTPRGEPREIEVWGCLDCITDECSDCTGLHVVMDPMGQYCVDCRRRIIGVGQSRP